MPCGRSQGAQATRARRRAARRSRAASRCTRSCAEPRCPRLQWPGSARPGSRAHGTPPVLRTTKHAYRTAACPPPQMDGTTRRESRIPRLTGTAGGGGAPLGDKVRARPWVAALCTGAMRGATWSQGACSLAGSSAARLHLMHPHALSTPDPAGQHAGRQAPRQRARQRSRGQARGWHARCAARARWRRARGDRRRARADRAGAWRRDVG